ncbi:hypothetical protein VNI00_012806 [Paramarasmius palmivorus]|uniref:Nicotinamide-nucleotide adenylyltransferase n=1 Tax=Paramarasmius palmivorus TaxID=297713 RepID=A0AAW0C5F7_9AGAR
MSLLNTITRLRSGLIVPPIELIYTPHPVPHPYLPSTLSVLDSSFNPPTLAHLALANHTQSPSPKLLLLSIRNADKQLKSGDATYVQRIEMMIALAKEIEGGAAVGIIDEPTFVGKSKMLLEKFPGCRLTFLLGYDTLERFFDRKYYPGDMYTSLRKFFEDDGSKVLCAKRSPGSYPSSSNPDLSSALEIFPVTMVDIGEDVWALSSSEVRDAVKSGNQKWKRMVPPLVAEYIEKEGLYRE